MENAATRILRQANTQFAIMFDDRFAKSDG